MLTEEGHAFENVNVDRVLELENHFATLIVKIISARVISRR